MFKRSLFFVLMLTLALPAFAAKPKKAKPVEPESALSAALAKPVNAGVESLDSVNEAMKKGSTKRPAALIRKVDAAKAELKQALERVRDARVEDDEAAAKDGAVVALAAAVRSADLVGQGLQEGDDDQVEAGLKLGEMARADLLRLDEQGDSGGVGGGGDEPYEIGPSFGANMSYQSQTGSSTYNADISLSYPLNKAMDLGAGFSVNASSSESGKTSSGAYGYGVNIFTRYHFLELFAAAPWVVPYVGAKYGINSDDNFSYTTGGTFSDTVSNRNSMGLQLGSLFFVNHKTAVTAQLESASNSSSSGTGASTTTSSMTLSMGLRLMF